MRVGVLAIGGSASVGKTTLASEIAKNLGLDRVVHVDDLRAAVESSAGPSFIDTTPDVWRKSAVWLADSLIEWTRHLHSAIAAEIDALVASPSRCVIEGEGVEPRLLRRWPRTVVRSVYVIETDADQLRQTFAARSSGARFQALSYSEQNAVVEMNRMYGVWLRQEAEDHEQPWVPAQPWETLADRGLTALTVP